MLTDLCLRRSDSGRLVGVLLVLSRQSIDRGNIVGTVSGLSRFTVADTLCNKAVVFKVFRAQLRTRRRTFPVTSLSFNCADPFFSQHLVLGKSM